MPGGWRALATGDEGPTVLLDRLIALMTHAVRKARGLLWAMHRNVQAHGIPSVGPNCILSVGQGATLVLGRCCVFDRHAEVVVCAHGKLVIGDDCYVGHGTTIACADSIQIGPETMIGDLVSIRDMNHRRVKGRPIAKSGIETYPIVVGKNCWVGSKVTLAAGCELGDEVTVGANAVVTRTFECGVTIGGVPASVIKGDVGETE